MPTATSGGSGSSRPRHSDFDLATDADLPPAEVYAFLAAVQDVEPIPRKATVRMRKEPPGPTRPGTR